MCKALLISISNKYSDATNGSLADKSKVYDLMGCVIFP